MLKVSSPWLFWEVAVSCNACLGRPDLGLLLLRLAAGGVLAAHGAQKLFGWNGGGGLDQTGVAMEAVGYVPGKQSAAAAGVTELGGGALLALGLATPAAGAVAAGAMTARRPCMHRTASSRRKGGMSTRFRSA